MKNFARIVDGVVVEIVTLPKSLKPTDIFSANLTGDWLAVPENVEPNWLYDGKTFAAPPTIEVDLLALKTTIKNQIDVAAENERLKYITDGVGQSMTYTEKFNQAVDYSKKYTAHATDPKNEPEPNEADYLLLKAGLGIDGKTLIEVAETVTYAYAVWQKIGAAIEASRLESKAAIENAKTAEEAQAIVTAIKWPQPSQVQQ